MAPIKPHLYYDNIATRRDAAGNFILPDANITVTDIAAGDYNKANLRDWRKYTKWKALNTTGTKAVKYNYGSAVSVSALVIFGHTLTGASWDLASSPDDITYTARTSGVNQPDNKILVKEFAAVSAQFWRLNLFNLASIPEIGELFIGNFLELPVFLGPRFNPKPYDVESQSLHTVEGHPTGVNVDFVKLQYDLELFPVLSSFVDATGFPSFQDLVDRCYIRREPFFFAWDPGDHPTETYMVEIPPGSVLETPYDRSIRSVKITMVGKTEHFES